MSRLSRGAQIILIGSICGLLLLGLGWVYCHQVWEHQRVSQVLNTLHTTLAKPHSSPLAELEAKKTQAEVDLAALKTRFPTLNQSIEVSQALFDLAETCQMGLPSLSISPAGSAEQSVFNINISLEGETSDLLDFMGRMNEALPTTEIVSTNISLMEENRIGVKLVVHIR